MRNPLGRVQTCYPLRRYDLLLGLALFFNPLFTAAPGLNNTPLSRSAEIRFYRLGHDDARETRNFLAVSKPNCTVIQ